MSTNKTQNYHLHSWLPADEFHVSEVNENFAALDREVGALSAVGERKAELVTGSYTGSGGTLRIALRGKPISLHIEARNGYRGDSSYSPSGGLYLQGLGSNYVQLDDAGFTVKSSGTSVSINSSGTVYVYQALLENS